MSAGEHGDEHLLDHLVLADDDLPDLVFQPRSGVTQQLRGLVVGQVLLGPGAGFLGSRRFGAWFGGCRVRHFNLTVVCFGCCLSEVVILP